jgi:hypothetical protein
MSMSQIDTVLIIAIGVVLMILLLRPKKEPEHMSGYGVISSLAMMNRDQYCEGPNGTGWSGGCFLPHRVIL